MPRPPLVPIGLLLLLGTACTGEVPSAPSAQRPAAAADLVGDRGNEFSTVPGVVNVCAFFPSSAGVGVASASFDASGPAGEDVIAGTQVLTPVPHCIEAWNATGTSTVAISASLVGNTPGYVLDRIVIATGTAEPTMLYNQTSATVNVSNTIGGYIWFKFTDPSVPELGGEGCTPGYWKHPQHFDSWTAPYTSSTLFSEVFDNAFPGRTLVQVLRLNGGGLNALGRHAVAALLSAASADVDYDLTVEEVISAFNAAYASGDAAMISSQKNVFDMLNNLGCPLN
jgi:hypothetical protein